MNNAREPQVIDTFLALTDTLVGEFDALDFLTMLAERAVKLLDLAAAGVILSDGHRGALSVAAATSERSRLLEVFAVAIDAGPCVDCVHTGEPVTSEDLTSESARKRWPRFVAGAADAGFRSVHALPMRWRGQVIGVLTLLHTDTRTLTGSDARVGQALADAGTIGLLHERAVRHAETVSEQLEGALESRVIIEQAKGVLAAQADIGPDEAFTILRSHARSNGLRLAEVARRVVEIHGVAEMIVKSVPRFTLFEPGGTATSDVAHDTGRGEATVTRRADIPPTDMLVDEDDGPARDLQDLVQTSMQERGWSYSDLQRASGGALTRGRWQQLGSGVPQRRFPDPASLTIIARALEVDITTVVLAAARSVSLDVSRQGAGLSRLLPERTELLAERMRDAILVLVRAAVADADRSAEMARVGSESRLE